MYKSTIVTLVAALFAMASCTFGDAEPIGPKGKYASHVSYVVSVSDLQAASEDGRALVDLWSPEYGYWVEPGVDHAAVDVICPSGRFMNLQDWTAELGMSPAQWEDGLFIYSSGAVGSQVEKYIQPELDCAGDCEAEKESDGSWACVC